MVKNPRRIVKDKVAHIRGYILPSRGSNKDT